jgi:diguanylate cyclase (GGDEF)-like protein
MADRPAVIALRRDGSRVPVEIALGPAGGGRVVAVVRDLRPRLHARRLEEENLQLRSDGQVPVLDSLTKCASRLGLQSCIDEVFEHGALPAMVARFNLHRFRRINDLHGFGFGDTVLQEVANALRAAVRHSDHVGRIGGDDFVVVMPDTQHAAALRACSRCLEAVQSLCFETAEGPLTLSASAAVGALNVRTPQLGAVLRQLTPTLARSRRYGSTAFSGQVDLSTATVAAVSQGIYALDGDEERLVSAELLARGEVAGLNLPGALFQLEPRRDVPNWLDLACLRAGIKTAIERGLPHAHVNLFPGTLLSVGMDELLAMIPTDRQWVVELSEHLFGENPSMLLERVKMLREHGLRIGIDDLGFGRSSLEALIVLEPDLVKIDRSLVTGAHADPVRLGQLARLVRMLQGIEVDTVAEGIETAEDLAVVRDLGIPMGQGYYWELPA